MSQEGSSIFMAFFNTNIVVTLANIQSGEIFCILEAIDKVICKQNWIRVFYGDLVNGVVVLDKMQFPIFLFNEEHRNSPRGFGWFHVTLF